VLGAAAPELIAIAPSCELRAEWRSDTHQLGAIAKSRESDVVAADPHARPAKKSLALFDGFPSFIERREVPSLAVSADDPELAARGVEREAVADGHRLDRFVAAEGVRAVNAGRVHGIAERV
jgi:hypothetical protein